MSAGLERQDPIEQVADSPEKATAKESLSNEYRDFLISSEGSVALSDIDSLKSSRKTSQDPVTGKVLNFEPGGQADTGKAFSIVIPDGLYKSPAVERERAENRSIQWKRNGDSPLRTSPERDKPAERELERPSSRNSETVSEDNPLVMSGNDAISLIARKAEGHEIWKQSRYREYLDGGKQADAASVSLVLKSVGYDYADSANTNNLVKKLVANGWQLVGVSQAREGDVIFGGKLGTRWNQDSRNAHIGIVGPDGSVYHNDSSSGKWTGVSRSDAFNSAQYGDQVFVLRPPLDPPRSSDASRDSGLAPRNFEDQFRRDMPGSGNRDGQYQYEYRPNRDDWQRYESDRDNRDGGRENGTSDYWKQYWSDYWRDYWREYYERGNSNRYQPSDRQTRPGDGRYEGQDGNSLEKSRRIYDSARSAVGKRMWQGSDYAPDTRNGKYGSTSSVSEVLQDAGFSYANGGRVSTLARQLLARGWQPVALDQLRPGDVLYGGKNANWEAGGGNANVAIVGENGKVFHNNVDTGVWTESGVRDAFPPGEFGQRIWALRPPDREVYIPPQRDEYAYRDYPGQDPNGYERRRRGDYSPTGDSSLAEIARNSVGRQLWRFIRGTPANLGCAASVSAVLSAGGYNYARSAGVGALESQLLNNGWQKMRVSEARPGDVVIGARTPYYARGGGGSHIGVVGENGKVYHNSSGQAKWIETSLNGYYNTSRFRAGVWILRPPGTA